MSSYQQLLSLFSTLGDLNHISAIMSWDEAVMMPAGAGERRGKAIATLERIKHENLCSSQVGDLLEQVAEKDLSCPWEQANYRWMKKLYLNATCLPAVLVSELTEARFQCEQAWRVLREDNNWHEFQPLLEKVLSLVKESANIRADLFKLSPYDVLLDDFSPGLTQAKIDPIFDELKAFLPDFSQQVMTKQQSISYQTLAGHYPIAQQKALGIELMKTIGFDFNHGRLDVSHHPFTGGDDVDVRITTRYLESDFAQAMMAVCHETGHAMYELGLPHTHCPQPVGLALGMSIHESQSLIIEMQACRSKEFLRFLSEKLKGYFGNHRAYDTDNLFNQYTQVKPSYIRVDADEVTYPLHVILRYEIEKQLIEENLAVSQLPELWNHYMQTLLGISTENNYKQGVMQDVHWPSAAFGYFPAYTLGAIIASQFYQQALTVHPNIPEALSQGDFSPLVQWLKQHVHQYGSLYDTESLIEQATGQSLSLTPYLDHLQQRYLPQS